MSSLSWLEASMEALKASGPLSVSDVLKRIESLELREITGNTPEATVGAVLYVAVANGDDRIRQAGPGIFEHTGSTKAPSTSVASLERLEEIDVRSVWKNEASDFTPWLLTNADYLGQVLGIDIEIDSKEQPVGDFSLDLIGRDISNACVLIVENQLSVTDHKHLGQLLTYAAGTEAATIVWVAPSFREEHRRALDYLNDKTINNIRFYGVEVRVVRIGNSSPAPMFHLVSQPSDIATQVAISGDSASMSPQRIKYLNFWTKYLEAIHVNHPNVTNARSPATRHFAHVNYLRRGVTIVLGFSVPQSKVLAEIYIDLKSELKNMNVLSALKAMQLDIEKEIGSSLIWDEIPGKRACRIRIMHDGNVDDESKHAEIIQWLMNAHAGIKKAFRPRVDALPTEIWDSDESDLMDEVDVDVLEESK